MRQWIAHVLSRVRRTFDRLSYQFERLNPLFSRVERLLGYERKGSDNIFIDSNAIGVWIRKHCARPLDRIIDRFPRFHEYTTDGKVRVISISRGDCHEYYAAVELQEVPGGGVGMDVYLRKYADECDPYVTEPQPHLWLNPAEADEVALILREAERYCRKPHRIQSG
jgi:hypothetical protein